MRSQRATASAAAVASSGDPGTDVHRFLEVLNYADLSDVNARSSLFISEDDLKGPTTATRVWVDDVNSDGKLDILVGDNTTLISAADGLSEEEFKEKQAAWQDEYNRVMAEWNALAQDTDAEKRNEISRKLGTVYQERSKFIIEDRTGFVWLYLQK